MNRERVTVIALVVVTAAVLLNAARLGIDFYRDEPAAVSVISPGFPTDLPTDPGTTPTGATTTGRPPPLTSSLDLPTDPRVVFLGDGTTAGVGLPQASSFAALASMDLGWSATIVPGGEGSGYLVAGEAGNYQSRLQRSRTRNAVDPVVVAGGQPDAASDTDLGEIDQADSTLFDSIVGKYPQATILVVGPLATQSPLNPRIRELDDRLASAAAAQGMDYLSPVQDGWFTTATLPTYLGPKGRLTEAGQQQVADRFELAVRDLG